MIPSTEPTEPFQLPQSNAASGSYGSGSYASTSYNPGSYGSGTYAAGTQVQPGPTIAADTEWMESPPTPDWRRRALYISLLSLLTIVVVAAGVWLYFVFFDPSGPDIVALLRGFGAAPAPTMTPAPELSPIPEPTTPAPPTSTPTEVPTSTPFGPLPDLVIVKMGITPRNGECDDGEGLQLEVVVANMGEVAAGDFVVEANGSTRPVEAGLSPDIDIQVRFDNFGASNTARVDPGGKVRESNEENNSMTMDANAAPVPTCVPDTPTPTVTPTSTPTATPTTPPPTSTPTATPTGIKGITSQPAPFRSSFGGDPSYWYQATEDSIVEVVGNVLQITIKAPHLMTWPGTLLSLENYYVEI